MIDDNENESTGCIQLVNKIKCIYNNIQNQLTYSLSIRLIGNTIYMVLRHPAIIALAILALFLWLLWADNVYALNNNTKPASPITSFPSKPSNNITITTNSNSVYSIPSTSVQVDRFSTNYTIAGTISSLNDSRDLITSTIVDDFDKNPNIGYVVNSSSSRTFSTASPSTTQLGLPNPFVSEDLINQKITNEIQGAIAAAAAAAASTSSTEKHVEIKCTFDMILADYKCS
jgi:hypothetical protein